MLFDTHCHLNDEEFADNYKEIIENARLQGVSQFAVPGFDLASSCKALEIADVENGVYAIVGIHPNEGIHVTEESYRELEELCRHPLAVAIGEIGLDYHWDTTPKDIQDQVFREQIRLAKRLRLPIVIHDREAHGDLVRILQEENAADVGGIMHCFSGSLEMAKQCMAMNFRISFGGPVTFKNAKKPQDIARQIPLDYLLVETDSPYLSPEPFRGKRNEPARVALVAKKVAELREMEYERLCEETTRNAEQLFRISEILKNKKRELYD
jgi:TatD DNase family protein